MILYIPNLRFFNNKIDSVLLRLNRSLKDGSFVSIYGSVRHYTHPIKKAYFRSIVKINGFYVKPTDEQNVFLVCYIRDLKYGIKELTTSMKTSLIRENGNLLKSFREAVLNTDKEIIIYDENLINSPNTVIIRSSSGDSINTLEKLDGRNRSQTMTN